METNEEKLEKLIKFLDEKKIKYTTETRPVNGFKPDLYIMRQHIAVSVGNDSDTIFNAWKRAVRPFFIRTEESSEYVVWKMQECLKNMDIRYNILKVWRAIAYEEKHYNVSFEEIVKEVESGKPQQELIDKYKAIIETAVKMKKKPKRKRVRIPVYQKIEHK